MFANKILFLNNIGELHLVWTVTSAAAGTATASASSANGAGGNEGTAVGEDEWRRPGELRLTKGRRARRARVKLGIRS